MNIEKPYVALSSTQISPNNHASYSTLINNVRDTAVFFSQQKYTNRKTHKYCNKRYNYKPLSVCLSVTIASRQRRWTDALSVLRERNFKCIVYMSMVLFGMHQEKGWANILYH